MVYVEDVQEAVSASQIKKRPDIDRVLARKATVNDFEVVMVQDLSRLTRGGIEHGMETFLAFKKAGLMLYSLQDGLILGEDMVMSACQRFREARIQAKQTAMLTRRGWIASKKVGRNMHTTAASFGTDRMIVNADGVELFRLRNLPNGEQLKMTPDGQTVLHHYPANESGECRHYIRSYGEYVTLVPGDPEHIAIVNEMMRMRFVEGVTTYSIARMLNDRRIPSPKNKLWCSSIVRLVTYNSVYFGTGVANRTTSAIFYKNGENFPVEITDNPLGQQRFRPEDEWVYKTYLALTGMINLPDEVRSKIIEVQYEWMRSRSKGSKNKRGGDRHKDSPYILKGLLTEKGTGLKLTGSRMSQTKKCPEGARYYIINKVRYCPTTIDQHRRRCVRADQIEVAAREAIREVLGSYQGLRHSVESALLAEMAEQGKSSPADEAVKLRARRQTLMDQIEFWVTQMGDLGKDELQKRIKPLKEEAVLVNDKLLAVVGQIAKKPAPNTAERVEAAFEHVSRALDSLSPTAMRDILAIICEKCEIDMATGHVEMVFRLPSWAVLEPTVFDSCLEKCASGRKLYDAYIPWSVSLGTKTWTHAFRARNGNDLLPIHLQKPMLMKKKRFERKLRPSSGSQFGLDIEQLQRLSGPSSHSSEAEAA